MTEKEWLASDNPMRMLELLTAPPGYWPPFETYMQQVIKMAKSWWSPVRTKPSDRKLRLFACACGRNIWGLLAPEERAAVEAAEKYADGAPVERLCPDVNDGSFVRAAWADTGSAAATLAAQRAALGYAHQAYWDFDRNAEDEQGRHAVLLRHIVGNPFRPYPAPPSWPSTVVQLAESLYAGQDCVFALHDALLEAGHAELAEHFREEKSHPKGCWVVDLLLEKD
jgi:hypothetical protein